MEVPKVTNRDAVPAGSWATEVANPNPGMRINGLALGLASTLLVSGSCPSQPSRRSQDPPHRNWSESLTFQESCGGE